MILFYDFHQSSLGNNNWANMIYLINPSIDHSTLSLLTMINENLMQGIMKKDIVDIENLGRLFSHFSDFYYI